MKKCLVFLSIGLWLLLCGPAWAGSWDVRVRWVPDGDTLYLESGQKVRLKGIDAPESGGEKAPAQYHAFKSRQGLVGLVENRTLRIEAETLDADRFGRILAYVRLPDNRMLNRVLIERGLAFFYPHPGQAQPHQEKLLRSQKRAMHERRGFWGRILTMPAARDRYIGNSNSLRFHSLDCTYGQRIKQSNRVEFPGLRQAFSAGYAPGRNCTPWPLQ